MKRNNKSKKKVNEKFKSNNENNLLYKTKLTIQKYINNRLKEINNNNDSSLSIKKNNNNMNQNLLKKNKYNLYHTNTSSTTLSEKSTINNNNISRDVNPLNLISFDIDEDYIKDKLHELELIKEENENLKKQIELTKQKENNLEYILNHILNNPYIQQKNFLIQVNKKKSKRIIKYTRTDNEEIYIDQKGNCIKEVINEQKK